MVNPVYADRNALYAETWEVDISAFRKAVSLPGQPDNVVFVKEAMETKIDSVFIGSCTNGRISDMETAASILKGRKVAPGVVLKIVPATDEIWNQCLQKGLIDIFKSAGALFGNAGCAGCASGQIGQNGPGERTVSTGNRNFPGKQGKGDVYLSSVETAAASAVAGHITTADQIPDHPSVFTMSANSSHNLARREQVKSKANKSLLRGRVWQVMQDNIDTDMIYHNRHLAVTNIEQMGQFTFGNLKGWEDFAKQAQPGDIIITGRNFGAGSSRQQAVDCFKSLGIQAIIAGSFGAIYERNAINAGFPVLTWKDISDLQLENGDIIEIDLEKSTLRNCKNDRVSKLSEFTEVQRRIYNTGDLLLI
jgi:3-isopropylmalate dehydratase small subunit